MGTNRNGGRAAALLSLAVLVAGCGTLPPVPVGAGPVGSAAPSASASETFPADSGSTEPATSDSTPEPTTAAPTIDPTINPTPATLPTQRPTAARPVVTPTLSAPASPTTPAPSPTTTAANPSASPTTSTKAPRRRVRPLPDPAALPGAAPGSRGVVYLTFDDGPSHYTAQVLAILTRYHATATFFELGVNQLDYPAAAAAVRAQGSVIGDHTYDHRDLTRLHRKEMLAEWRGGPHATCGRPPYGATNAKVVEVMHSLGLREVLWDVDSLDWTLPGTEAIYRRAASAAVHPGSVILMHDGGGGRAQTVAALPRILAELQRRGYLIRALPGC